MSSFYQAHSGRRRAGLAVAVAAVLGALAAAQIKGNAATTLDIALLAAIALTGLAALGGGAYLAVRARRALAEQHPMRPYDTGPKPHLPGIRAVSATGRTSPEGETR